MMLGRFGESQTHVMLQLHGHAPLLFAVCLLKRVLIEVWVQMNIFRNALFAFLLSTGRDD